MIGGMSWESTVTYYQVANREVKKRLGGFHSAKCVIVSVDFSVLEANMRNADWGKNARILAKAAKSLEAAGADCVLLCTNSMHKVADAVAAAVEIPFFHIADLTAEAIHKQSLKRVGLLGTLYTMEQDFYTSRLEAQGIEVVVPDAAGRKGINEIIFNELCQGTILPDSKRYYIRQIAKLREAGAEGIIFGCTEIGLLLDQDDVACPVFDTALLHAAGAVQFSLTGEIPKANGTAETLRVVDFIDDVEAEQYEQTGGKKTRLYKK